MNNNSLKRALLVSLGLILPSLALTQTPLPKPDIKKSLQQLDEQGYFGQAQFFRDVELTWPECLPTLKKNINHPNKYVREMIIKSFRFHQAPCENVSALLAEQLNDVERKIRYEAIYALQALNCLSQIDKIIHLIKNEKDESVLNVAVASLGSLDHSSNVNILQEIQKDPSRPLKTRLHAAFALAKLKGPYDPDLIREGLDHSSRDVNKVALRALGKTGDISLRNELDNKINSVRSRNPNLSEEILFSEKSLQLYSKTDREKEDFLFSLLTDSDPTVREWAALKITEDIATVTSLDKLESIATSPEHKGKEEALLMLIQKKLRNQDELLKKLEENLKSTNPQEPHK